MRGRNAKEAGRTPSRWASSPTRPDRSRSSASPTPTWPGWSSATSTPGAACSGGTWSCCSRTARPTTPSPRPRRRSSSSEDQVDVVFGGIYSSTRQAIKGPAVVEGKTLYIYPEQYEGQESDPLIFCTGPVPAQQVDPFIPWLMRETGAKTVLPAVRRLHLAARHERAGPRGRRRPTAGRSSARSTSRSTTWTTARPSSGSPRAGRTRVQHHRAARGRRRSSRSCTTPGFSSAAGSSSARTSTRTSSTWCRRPMSRACTGAWTTTRPSTIRSAGSCSSSTTRCIPATRRSPAAARCSGLYRGLRLWAAAVTEAGSLVRRT